LLLGDGLLMRSPLEYGFWCNRLEITTHGSSDRL
jgi:hypothetical protein